MKKVTNKTEETQALGEGFAQKLRGGEIICLEGDLGSGKTTFTQGMLKGLSAEGPYTSPTFVIMKEYKIKTFPSSTPFTPNAYHIDAYRVGSQAILDLGWNEITSNKNIVIVEWPERIKEIIPENAIWIRFRWIDKEKREIIVEL